MEKFVAYNPVKLHFGVDVIVNLGETVKEYGNRVLFVYGKGSVKKFGYYDQVIKQLKDSGLEIFEFSGIKSNPIIEDVEKATLIGKENNIDLQFEFIPFSILSREYAISEAADYLEELGVKLVVGFDNYHYEGMAETIGEKDIFFISPLRSTSSINDAPQNWIGVRPPTRDGIVEAEMLTELGIEAVIVLQNEGSINGGSMINETYHDFKQTYEAQGGVVYDHILYPQPDVVSSVPEGNSDFTEYLAEADSSMASAIQEYGLEHVGVFVIGFEPYPIAYQAKDFENLIKVPWSISYQMGFAVLGQNDMSQQMSLLKGYSTQEIVENLEAYLSLSEEAREYNPSMSSHHGLFRIQEAVRYDACWLMALSVIEAESSDPTTVQAVFPQVAATYDGVNGNYRLDENMDRDNYVMGIVEIQEAPPDLIYSYVPVQIGVYHSDTGVIVFHEPLSLYNLTYP